MLRSTNHPKLVTATKVPMHTATKTPRHSQWWMAALSLLLASGGAARAHAQQGFALNQFDPAVIGSDWFDGDSLDFRGHGRAAFGVTLDYAHEPLVARDDAGDITVAPVQNQMFVHLAGAVNLWDRLRLDMVLPLAAWNRGETATVDGVTYPAPVANGMGDLRLGADLRLVGKYQGAFSLALGMHVRLPTGSRDAYTSDGATQIGGRLLAAGDLAWFAYSLRIGIEGRFEETTVDGVAVGNELTYGATAGVRFAKKHGLIGVEWYGGGGLVSGSTFDPKTLPQELLGSFSYRVGDVLLGAAAGPGLTEAFGSPVVRALARLVWFPEPKEPPPPPPEEPPPPPPDCDGDGVINDEDACPAAPGPRSDDPQKNGCPPPIDTDGDGFPDPIDACPRETGVSSEDPALNGCPPPDPDRDHDGILNDDDACPDAAGRASPEPSRHGCPIVMVTDSRIEISQRVEFDTNKASIDKVSFELLDAVASTLVEHPELRLIEVEGHTDNKGSAARNRKLSKQRADSVKKYLVNKGVAADRLLAAGRGPDVPIADNDTDEGRTTNRRVEFHIRRRDPTPTKLVEVPHPADAAAPAGPTTP